jgi:hypothetical protein
MDVSVLSAHDHLVARHAEGRREVAIPVDTSKTAGEFGVFQLWLLIFLILVVLLILLLSTLSGIFGLGLAVLVERIVRFGS